MGIQLVPESPEEIEARRREATATRIKVLTGVVVLAVAARLIISDPKRPPPPDYSKIPVKIVPGMLDTLTPEARAQMDQTLIAKMVLVDEQARRGVSPEQAAPVAEGTYKVADAPAGVDAEGEAYKEQLFAYAKKRRIEAQRAAAREQEQRDVTKSTLVQFTSGGYVHAESAKRTGRETAIRVSRALEVELPNRWVSSIKTDAVEWTEPVPSGRVKLKPAKGITAILFSDTARRVTVKKTPTVDEI